MLVTSGACLTNFLKETPEIFNSKTPLALPAQCVLGVGYHILNNTF
jgi:hypothetical protein